MRLAVLPGQGAPARLAVPAPGGYVALHTAAERLGLAPLPALQDVADVYRAGPEVVEAVRSVAEQATRGAVEATDGADGPLGPPVQRPAAFVCIGRNYLEHIQEGDAPVPEYPILFSKFANTLVGHRAPVRHHRITEQLDYEGELAVVIGRRATAVPAASAMEVVAGYTIVNDISARDLQYRDLQWIRGKSLDTWAPLGPVFVSADEIPDPYALRIQTTVNGELRQDAPVSDMLFKIPELIAFVTEAITLEPGDLIATGTPSGVGLGFDPPRWLQVGDVVEVTISPIGSLASGVVA